MTSLFLLLTGRICTSQIRRSPFLVFPRPSSSPVCSFRFFGVSTAYSDSANVSQQPLEDLTRMLDLSPLTGGAIEQLEPAFSSLGLGHAYPSGWLQSVMEGLHIHCDLPWWGTIVVTTVALRILMFPIVILAQKSMIRLNNHLPEMQKRQVAMLTATDNKERLLAQKNFHAFMAEKDINPMKNYVPLIGQGAVFCSMFFAIRGMASCPVESLKTQGLLWFVDLTATDPLFLLPCITATSVLVHLKVGADGVDPNSLPPMIKKFLLMLPLISLPVMCQFPAALNLYWLTTNLISIGQSRVIRRPAIRDRLGLGELISWKPEDLPMSRAQLVNPFKREDPSKEEVNPSHLETTKVDLKDVQQSMQGKKPSEKDTDTKNV